MRPVEELVNHVLGQFRMLRDAPVPFIAAVIVAGVVIWLAMDWRYSGIIANRDSEISALKTQIEGYRNVFNGAEPEQVLKKITALQNQIASFLPPRRLTESDKKKLSDQLRPIASELKELIVYSDTSSESRRYATDFLAVLRELELKPTSVLTLTVEENQEGLMVGLVDPKNPSPAATRFIEALKKADLKIHTTLWSAPQPQSSRDFDLFIGPQ